MRRLVSFGLLIVLALVVRFFLLGSIPPGGNNSFWLRLPSALAGVLSIIMLMWLVWRLSQNFNLTWFSGLSLTLMPWHIEQSRVVSEPLLGMTTILVGVVFFTYKSNRIIKLIGLIGLIGIFYKVYPSFWLFYRNIADIDWYYFLDNLFKLVSIEFLFFKNDSFWWGGLRSMGTMLPMTIPIFLLGLYQAIKEYSNKHLIWLASFGLILIIAATSPNLPESREFFLGVPLLAVIIALGLDKLTKIFFSNNKKIKLVIWGLLLLLIYDYLLFFHFYTYHYPQRISHETSYEQRDY